MEVGTGGGVATLATCTGAGATAFATGTGATALAAGTGTGATGTEVGFAGAAVALDEILLPASTLVSMVMVSKSDFSKSEMSFFD